MKRACRNINNNNIKETFGMTDRETKELQASVSKDSRSEDRRINLRKLRLYVQ